MSNEFDTLRRADPAAAARLLAAVRKRAIVLHPGQAPVASSKARYRILRAGRRFGKTKLAARELIAAALRKPGGMNWWVANTYKNVRRGYREVLRQLPRELLAKEPPPPTANELVIQLRDGTMLEFYSGGSPDAMAGEGLDFLVVDEAALIPDNVWSQILRPALLDTKGRALVISTPRGHNWFYRLEQAGLDDERRNYEAWHLTSFDNPYIDNDEIEDLRLETPEILFRQEILAEYLEDDNAIFNLAKARIVAGFDPDLARGPIYMGVDLAEHHDFTVIRAGDAAGRPVYHERFHQVGWGEQRERITSAATTLLETAESVTIGIDSAGAGDVVYEELDDLGLFDVEPIKWGSPGQKHKMVKLAGSDIENQRVVLMDGEAPNAPETEEMKDYRYKITPNGVFTYSAPEGKFDDQVAALMMECWVRKHASVGGVVFEAIEDLAAEEPEFVEPDPLSDLLERDAVWTRAL